MQPVRPALRSPIGARLLASRASASSATSSASPRWCSWPTPTPARPRRGGGLRGQRPPEGRDGDLGRHAAGRRPASGRARRAQPRSARPSWATVALFPTLVVALIAAALLGACRTAFLGVQSALLGESVHDRAPRPACSRSSGTINQVGPGRRHPRRRRRHAHRRRPDGVADRRRHVRRRRTGAVQRCRAAAPARGGSSRPRPLDGVRAVLAEPTLRRLAPVAWTCMVASLLPETLAADAVARRWVPAAMAASPLGGASGTCSPAATTVPRLGARHLPRPDRPGHGPRRRCAGRLAGPLGPDVRGR